jgi:hypothetical protein
MTRTKLDIIIQTQSLVTFGILEADPRFMLADLGELMLICNGCGTEKSSLVPDHMYGLYIGYCCYIHDYDYYLGQTEADRRFADERFKRNLRAMVRLEGGVFKPVRYLRVNTYYQSVRICGEQAFWQNKEINLVTLQTFTVEA